MFENEEDKIDFLYRWQDRNKTTEWSRESALFPITWATICFPAFEIWSPL